MAYWSKHPDADDIYHTCKNCTLGNNIEGTNLESNSPPDGFRKCKECIELEGKGECTPGVPEPAE